MAEEDVAKYLMSDHKNIFGIHILFADWWWQYTDEEFKAAATEHERVLKHIAKHGTLPKDMDPKLRQAGIPKFFTNAALPVLKSVFPKSLKVDMAPFKICLSNGKVLRTVIHALTLAQIDNLAALLETFIEIKVKFLNLTHMKEFDMSSKMLDMMELLKTIARKGQCVVEVWWNNKKGHREVIMPDGEVYMVSKDFTSTEYKTTRVETVVAEHYEEMMLHFSLNGITEKSNPVMLQLDSLYMQSIINKSVMSGLLSGSLLQDCLPEAFFSCKLPRILGVVIIAAVNNKQRKTKMDYKNYYVAKVTQHVDGMPVPGTSKKLRFYDDELKQSRFFNGHNFEDVIAMKVAYDDNSYGYVVDYTMHISL